MAHGDREAIRCEGDRGQLDDLVDAEALAGREAYGGVWITSYRISINSPGPLRRRFRADRIIMKERLWWL